MSEKKHPRPNQNTAKPPFPKQSKKVGIHISEEELEASGFEDASLREELLGDEVADQVEQETERTLWVGRPSVRKNSVQAVLVFVLSLVIWTLSFESVRRGDLAFLIPLAWAYTLFWTLVVLGVVFFLVYIWYLFWARRYRVTSERLFLHSNSIFFRQIDEIEMVMVEDVKIEQTFWQRLFAVADITFRTKSKIFRNGRFRDVPDYYRVKEIIREMILMHRQRGNVMMNWQMESR